MKHQVSILSDRYPLVKDVGVAMTPVTWSHPDHCLDTHVLVFIISGTLEVWEDDTEYFIEQSEVFFMKKGIRHWGERKTLPGTAWYWIHFDEPPNVDLSQYEEADKNYDIARLSAQENVTFKITLPKRIKVHQSQYVEHTLKKMLELYRSQVPLRSMMLSVHTAKLLLELYQQSIREKKMTKLDRTVEKITEAVERHVDNKFDSSVIAESLNLNYNYLSTVFKEKMGISISEYHTMLRIRKAMELLKDSSYNITEVSEKMGFSNPYHFSSVFKKSVGVSPSQYIKQIYR